MTRREAKQEWILLIHQLPPKPTSLRVRIWRKLQKLGAVSIKNSIYILPFCDKTHEDFQWLKQEIESSGGEATVFKAVSVEGKTDEEIVSAFRRQKDDEYARVTAELDGLTGAIREQKRGGHSTPARISRYETELDKLHAELEGIIATDFFRASKRDAALASYEGCRKGLDSERGRGAESKKSGAVRGSALKLAEYQGRHWVTRPNLHIDRLASGWLISRFIDGRARFSFVDDRQRVEGSIPFDMFGAEFAHQGEDCTFETLIKRFGLDVDPALREIAEIVHDIDLKDDKFHRLEAAGLNATVRGLGELVKDDRKLLRQCGLIFDGLYLMLGEGAKKNKGKANVSAKRTGGRTRRGGKRAGRK